MSVNIASWMRDHDASLTAEVDIERYDAVQITVRQKGKPDLVGYGWDLNAAFSDAVTPGSDDESKGSVGSVVDGEEFPQVSR